MGTGLGRRRAGRRRHLESVGARAGKLVARAFDRAEARLAITRPGEQVSFDELLREVFTEIRVMVDVRAEKDHRRIRKAASRIHEGHGLIELIEALGRPPGPGAGGGPASGDPSRSGMVLPGKRLPPQWDGPPGVPRWHPEHRLNESEV
jgi:hypothetical protein